MIRCFRDKFSEKEISANRDRDSLVRESLQINSIDDSKKHILQLFNKFTEEIVSLTGDNFWFSLQKPVGEVVYDSYDYEIPKIWTNAQRLMIGNFLFKLIDEINLDFYTSFAVAERSYCKNWKDILGFKKSLIMNRILKRGVDEYKNQNNKYWLEKMFSDFGDFKSPRADYLRGQAYWHLKEWDKCIWHMEKFLAVINNPKCIGDIITGSLSVQFAYYTLGACYQQKMQLYRSFEYFNECKQITDDLLLGNNLYIMDMFIP
jgi:hypothetical protein